MALISYAAFVRGINVGGNALISMAKLKAYFEELGYENVATYINSGNIVFQSTKKDPRRIESSITKALVDHFQKEIAAVVLSAVELDELLDSIPESWHGKAEEKRNVIFLRHTIDKPSILKELKPPKDDIESVEYVPHALLWSAQTSQLTKSSMIKVSSSPRATA